MQSLDTFSLIIAASGIIILSYFFNILSKKTNIPSVLMLIVLGVVVKLFTDVDGTKFKGILEILGNVGLIMIVLEAALDLKLAKDKWPIIWKSFCVALFGLLGSTFFIAFVISFFLGLDMNISIIYAVPLGIMSSAIAIPSVAGLVNHKKEFMIYESTFSDILGIMLFYFILGNQETTNTQAIVFDVTSNIAVTVVLSIVLSYALVFVFQKIKTQVKLFLLISVLTLLYAVGKKFHLSSLVIVLVFGLILNNHHIFFRGFLKKYLDVPSVSEILHNFHLITAESAFVVRTFFFVIFGISISLISLLSVEFAVISAFIVLGIYTVRFAMLKVFQSKSMTPEIFIAPRGLITILLFYGIPEELRSEKFDESILLFTILATSLIMTFALVKNSKASSIEEVLESLEHTETSTDTIENPTKEL